MEIKYLIISLRLVVYTNINDYSSDFLPEVLCLNPFNNTFQAVQQHNFILSFLF